jgi:hypothetical protein
MFTWSSRFRPWLDALSRSSCRRGIGTYSSPAVLSWNANKKVWEKLTLFYDIFFIKSYQKQATNKYRKINAFKFFKYIQLNLPRSEKVPVSQRMALCHFPVILLCAHHDSRHGIKSNLSWKKINLIVSRSSTNPSLQVIASTLLIKSVEDCNLAMLTYFLTIYV